MLVRAFLGTATAGAAVSTFAGVVTGLCEGRATTGVVWLIFCVARGWVADPTASEGGADGWRRTNQATPAPTTTATSRLTTPRASGA